MRKPVTRVGILFASLVLAAGCGGGSQEGSSSTTVATESAPAETTTRTNVAKPSKPIRCLDAAGLSDVEEQDAGVWRGSHESPPYAIVVHELAKSVRTPIVVAGTYIRTGRFKVAAKGTGLPNWGLEADFLVEEVADCLGG